MALAPAIGQSKNPARLAAALPAYGTTRKDYVWRPHVVAASRCRGSLCNCPGRIFGSVSCRAHAAGAGHHRAGHGRHRRRLCPRPSCRSGDAIPVGHAPDTRRSGRPIRGGSGLGPGTDRRSAAAGHDLRHPGLCRRTRLVRSPCRSAHRAGSSVQRGRGEKVLSLSHTCPPDRATDFAPPAPGYDVCRDGNHARFDRAAGGSCEHAAHSRSGWEAAGWRRRRAAGSPDRRPRSVAHDPRLQREEPGPVVPLGRSRAE